MVSSMTKHRAIMCIIPPMLMLTAWAARETLGRDVTMAIMVLGCGIFSIYLLVLRRLIVSQNGSV